MNDIDIPMTSGHPVDVIIDDAEEMEVQAVDKHEKFQEKSAELVKKAITMIEKVGDVSNKKKFEYSEEEVEVMFAALEEALADTKHMFKKKKEFHW